MAFLPRGLEMIDTLIDIFIVAMKIFIPIWIVLFIATEWADDTERQRWRDR